MRRALASALAVALLSVLVEAAPTPAAPRSVLVVGDSLVVGTTPYLRRELSGVPVTSDGRIGRPSTEAVQVLGAKLAGQEVVVFDAGVNDDPGQPSRLSSDLASARSLVHGRCLVVATMSRPPYRGVTVDGLNRAVRSFAAGTSNARLVDWRAAALANPGLINSDGVHPTPAGYQLRARLFAQAIASCGSSAPPVAPGTQSPGAATPPGVPAAPRPHRRRSPRPKPPRKPVPPKPPPTLGSQSPVLTDEPVSVQSVGARLSGELIAPAGGSRHPAVVMIQGSGPATREPYREQAEFLAQHGVAALIYDKRGAGESTGGADYRYSQLADDVRAWVAALRARPEVTPEAIGLWGLSEGGTIAPMVAAGNPQVAAVMVVSAAAIPRASQEEWAVRNRLGRDGAGSGTAAASRYYAVASDLDSGDLGFDPVSAWRRVAQPVLAVWGAADDIVPAHDSAAALASALAGGGVNRDREFRSFPAATHVLGVAAESGRPGSAPGFKELSAAWLRAHLAGRRPAPVVSTPLPPRSGPPVVAVQRASLLERWPVQLAWLVLPALALVAVGIRLRRRRESPAVPWWWLAGVLALDLLALGMLAAAVATMLDAGGQGVEAVAGVPLAVVFAWLLTIAGAAGTVLVARRVRRAGGSGIGLVLAGSAWLVLAVYWLV